MQEYNHRYESFNINKLVVFIECRKFILACIRIVIVFMVSFIESLPTSMTAAQSIAGPDEGRTSAPEQLPQMERSQCCAIKTRLFCVPGTIDESRKLGQKVRSRVMVASAVAVAAVNVIFGSDCALASVASAANAARRGQNKERYSEW